MTITCCPFSASRPDPRHSRTDADQQHRIAELPEGFDPQEHPIISQHWYGVKPCPMSAAETVSDLRFQRQVEHLHGLGARATAELLAELAAERSIRTVIDRKLAVYAALTSEQLMATGGDRFSPPPIRQVRP